MKLFRYRATPYAFLFWLFFIWLLHNEVVSQSFLTKDAYIDINDGALIMRQDYLGYYLGSQKIGYSQYILKEDRDDSPVKLPGRYFLFESDSFLQIQALGIPITLKTKQYGDVNEDLTLRNFTFSYEASGQSLTVKVNVESDGLHITTKSAGDTSESVIPLSGPVYHTDMIHLVVARQGLEVGKKYVLPVFEAMTMSLTDAVVTVLEKEKITLPDGDSAETFKIETSLKGFKSTSWINEDGDVYKEMSTVVGITSTAMRETKEQAFDMNFVSGDVQHLEESAVDLIQASRITVDPPISNPASVKKMVIKLIGAEKEDIVIDGTYQTLQSADGDQLVLEIQRQNYEDLEERLADVSEAPPYENSDPDLQAYLAEGPLVQSNNPQIREKAKEIADEAKSQNPWQASKAIADWLYQNIEKEMRVTIPSAVEVLNSMKGDCNEHSTLFAALARALGIPAKICAGIVYQEDGFYYHAWNEVSIDGKWLPIDATLDRIKMDAAHVKLAEGSLDSQSDIVKLIGNLQVEILSIE
ncbi:MAG: transglutaminase domain-containing protein [Candidatus Omnitrophica bacterium]|nr:transglutaminase domain-containing protein [Candidatus Omnitrophota bacterium]